MIPGLRRAAVLAAALLLTSPAARADEGRVQAANLLLWQVGRDPGTQFEERTALFDQVRLDYLSGDFRVGARAETYRTSTADLVHEEITHRFVEWRGRDLSLRVGNGYATLGRGLIFRAHELPGVVREITTLTDSKYMDTRDLDGVILEGRRGRAEAVLVSGRPLAFPDNPPGLEETFGLVRREGTVSGGRVGVDLGRGVRVGQGYVRAEGFTSWGRAAREEYGSLDAAVRLHRLLPALDHAGWDVRLSAELAARDWNALPDLDGPGDGVPRARTTLVEAARGRWSVIWETKDYERFRLPYNDPPNLVPELSPSLVNRRSHFLFADDEHGHLVSVQGAVGDGWTLHLERAAARLLDDAMDYRLTYLEAASPPLADTRLTVFVAEGRDDIEGLERHRSAGLAVERSLSGRDAVQAAVEVQDIRRPGGGDALHHDVLLSVGAGRAGLGSVTLVLEMSDDPTQTDDPQTFDVVETDRRRWLGLNVQADLDRSHQLAAFAGRRRGGTACTSGVCYLVPDFRGVEVRLSSRF